MSSISADVCVIGSGASGAVVADAMVRGGLSVCVVEQGQRLPARYSYEKVLRRAERAWVKSETGWQRNGYPWSTCNFGGGTVFYGAASFRFRNVDFDCSRFILGEDLDVAWPMGYADLAPHYDAVEERIGVARVRGLDPTEPPMLPTERAPHPPSAEAVRLFEAAQRLGLRPFPTPLAIRSRPIDGKRACDGRRACIEHACSCAKGDVVSAYWHPIAKHPRLRILCDVRAVGLDSTRADRASALRAVKVDSGEQIVIKANLFVLAANAAQSAALLLASMRPGGGALGDEYGLVGRGLSVRPSAYVEGVFPSSTTTMQPRRNPLHGPFSTFSLTDYYVHADCASGLGGLIYEAKPGIDRAGSWGGGSVRLECMIGDRPSFDNRIWLASRGGSSSLHMHYRTDPRDARRLQFLLERAKDLLSAAGASNIRSYYFAAERGTGHLLGTCRAGRDARSSVVNADGRLHLVENVYVADGGYMPFAGGVNPTLTIQANARRIAAALLHKMRCRA